MKKCLVTNGTGFIGANITRALVHAGYHVHILVEPETNYWRLEDIKKAIEIHEIDLIDFYKINTLVKQTKPEVIFNLASFGGMPNQQDQQTIYDVNLASTINLLNICKDTGFDCFINTGCSSEYGTKSNPMKESDLLEPVSDYGIAKAASTLFCLKEARVNKLPIYSIRPFSVYGDYEMPARLIPTVLVSALNNKSISLSNPHNVRDYIYIEDLVQLYLEIMRKKPGNNFIFNGGTGVQSSINDVVNTTQACVDHKITVQWGQAESRPWEPAHWKADMTLVKEVLGWRPHYPLAQGIKKSLTWYRNHLEFYTKHADNHAHATIAQQPSIT